MVKFVWWGNRLMKIFKTWRKFVIQYNTLNAFDFLQLENVYALFVIYCNRFSKPHHLFYVKWSGCTCHNKMRYFPISFPISIYSSIFFTVSSQIFVSLCLRFRYNRNYVYISYFRTHTFKSLHLVCSSAMLRDSLIPSLFYLSFTFLLIRVRKLSLCRLSVLVMVFGLTK